MMKQCPTEAESKLRSLEDLQRVDDEQQLSESSSHVQAERDIHGMRVVLQGAYCGFGQRLS